MGINIVTGFGQRTGTSFVMQKIKEKGLPVCGEKFLNGITVEKHNPNGYWDINPLQLADLISNNKLDSKFCKLWANVLQFIPQENTNLVIVLERKNKEQQLSSMQKVLNDELELPINKIFYNGETVKDIYENTVTLLNAWLQHKDKSKVLHIYTEELDNSLSSIYNFIERGLKCH